MTDTGTGSKTAKSEVTKKKIIDSYLELIPRKKWDKITVKELCVQAGITRGTFYQYFNDIYDMMEQIEEPMLDDLNHRYQSLPAKQAAIYPPEQFNQRFEYGPPKELFVWFNFCKKYHNAVAVLLDPRNGDTYFVKKLKTILTEHINRIMDCDGMPKDSLREHFTKIFLELHFLSARSWLDSTNDTFLATDEIINLLNTMRVGANYLSYKQLTAPDFNDKMNFTLEEAEET